MRRKEHERDETFAWGALDSAPYAVLALADEHGAPYCVPISPARDGRTVYFHCARSGEKLALLQKNPRVALTAVSYHKTVPVRYTMSYASVVLRGRASVVEDEAERALALRRISERYAPGNLDKFASMMERHAKAALVVRIDVEEITGKEAKNG